MKPNFWFLKTYLIISLFFGTIDLIDNFLTFLKISYPWYTLLLSIFFFLFFFFNIFFLIIFRQHRVLRIAYLLPIYYLISYAFFFVAALFLSQLEVLPSWLVPATIIFGVVTSIFEMGFSIYLLQKINFAPAL